MSSTATQEEKFPIGSLWASTSYRSSNIIVMIIDAKPEIQNGTERGHNVALAYYYRKQDGTPRSTVIQTHFGVTQSMDKFYKRIR